MRIEIEIDVTRGFAVGDVVWWYGTVTSAPDQTYANQMFQRQIMDVDTSGSVTVLGVSNLNSGAVMLEEKVGEGRIVAMDLVSPVRPWYNSWGSTNKYLFLGNIVGNAVRYGKHYPERLSYDGFVDLMFDTAERYPDLHIEDEGRSSDGRPIYSLNIGDEANPTMCFGAAIHGWEWENAYGLLRLAEVLCRNPDVEGNEHPEPSFQDAAGAEPGGIRPVHPPELQGRRPEPKLRLQLGELPIHAGRADALGLQLHGRETRVRTGDPGHPAHHRRTQAALRDRLPYGRLYHDAALTRETANCSLRITRIYGIA